MEEEGRNCQCASLRDSQRTGTLAPELDFPARIAFLAIPLQYNSRFSFPYRATPVPTQLAMAASTVERELAQRM